MVPTGTFLSSVRAYSIPTARLWIEVMGLCICRAMTVSTLAPTGALFPLAITASRCSIPTARLLSALVIWAKVMARLIIQGVPPSIPTAVFLSLTVAITASRCSIPTARLPL